MNGAGPRRSRATTATRRGSRSPRSPGGSDGLRPPSRHTCMTRLRLTKDLRIALRAKSASARRAPRTVPPGARVAPGLSRAERTPPWRDGARLRPIPAGARAYAGGAATRTLACSAPSRSASPVLRDRALGKRGAASRRSAVSSRPLCGAHNSAIRGGHGHAVDAASATVAKG